MELSSTIKCLLTLYFQRLQFDVTSPNGVLLFREASKTITSYGDHILSHGDIPDDKLYALKYPHILSWKCQGRLIRLRNVVTG